MLQVSVGFISKYKQLFKEQGINGLTLKHQGSSGYLDANARREIIEWLHPKNYWNLGELKQYVLDSYSNPESFMKERGVKDILIPTGSTTPGNGTGSSHTAQAVLKSLDTSIEMPVSVCVPHCQELKYVAICSGIPV